MAALAIAQITHHAFEHDFRRWLLRAAADSGAPALHIQCTDRVRIRDLAGDEMRELAPGSRELARWLAAFRARHHTVALTGLGGVVQAAARQVTRQFARAQRVYDVQDDLSYGSTGVALLKFCARDLHWRALCGQTLVLERAMRRVYPFSRHLDNASHLRPLTQITNDLRLVYIGSIDRRLDLELISRIARVLPVDVHGAFHPWAPEIGERLRALTRVTPGLSYRGPYRNEDLPEILSAYSIGLVPYQQPDRMTRHVNPDKIYHYLNAGLGVISSGIPQCKRMAAHLAVVDAHTDIARAAELALARRKHWRWQDHTWQRRWQQFCQMMSGPEAAR